MPPTIGERFRNILAGDGHPDHQDLSYPASESNSSYDDFRPLLPGAEAAARRHTRATLPSHITNICCIGAGHVGGPNGAVIAYKNPEVTVCVVDLDQARIDAWNSNSLPIYEPGLEEIVRVARGGVRGLSSTSSSPLRSQSPASRHNGNANVGRAHGQREANLFFMGPDAINDAIGAADVIFLSVNTPTKEHGLGKGAAADLEQIETTCRIIADAALDSKIVVEKSTVPCRTAESVGAILEANAQPNVRFEILSNPEFLAEGTAVADLLNPDRMLIGSKATSRGHRAAELLADVYRAWVPSDRIITMNLWSSELAKLAANALLAQRVSSINALSALCEATGANIDEVGYACGLDSRIGPRMLKAGPGFGGSCFKKDILSLVYLAESLHLDEVAAYWKSVVTINDYQKDRFAKRIISALFNTLGNKKVAVLGFAYKKDTGDTRGSAAIDLAKQLLQEKAHVAIYDPVVKEAQIYQDLRLDDFETPLGLVTVHSTAYEACANADAVVIMTEWEEFGNKITNAQSSPTTAGAMMQLDPNRVGVSQLATSASSVSIKSLSGKLEKALSGGINGHATPTVSSPLRDATNRGGRASFAERFGLLDIRSDGSVGRLDWRNIADGMKNPKFVFDGRNIMDVEKLEKLGFQVEVIGRASTGKRG